MLRNVTKINGIVLDKRDISNGDRYITVLTDYGNKVTLFIKGIAKSKNREILAADLLSYSEFIFGQSKVISSISLIKSFDLLNIKNLKNGLYLAKVANHFIQENNINSDTFSLLYDNLHVKEKIDENSISKFLLEHIKSEGIYSKDILKIEDISSLERYIDRHLDLSFSYKEFMSYVI